MVNFFLDPPSCQPSGFSICVGWCDASFHFWDPATPPIDLSWRELFKYGVNVPPK